jgi:hypothetical protein
MSRSIARSAGEKYEAAIETQALVRQARQNGDIAPEDVRDVMERH